MSATPAEQVFEARLSRLADLGVTVGVNLQRSQELIITAPLEASALVQHVTRVAYQHGARLVTCLYDDPAMISHRFLYAADETLDYAPEWFYRGTADALGRGAARLYIVGPYPDLLSGVPPERIVRVHRAMAQASRAESELTSGSRINWSTLPCVTGSWAKQVFPDLAPDEATHALWEAVFDATRVTCDDPREAWRAHNAVLNARRDRLQARRFASLRFHDGRTDLTIGLAEGHQWAGGTVIASNGIEGTCNIPTEEIFTCPHRERTHGRLVSSRPLALGGALVEGLRVEFRDGIVTSVSADRGQEVFEKLIASDEGARRLGEIGLVPGSSRIAQRGILFYNALFDENAASHVAFGQSYAACVRTDEAAPVDQADIGANHSAIHIDVMFGNAAMNVDGFPAEGVAVPVMRAGEFVG